MCGTYHGAGFVYTVERYFPSSTVDRELIHSLDHTSAVMHWRLIAGKSHNSLSFLLKVSIHIFECVYTYMYLDVSVKYEVWVPISTPLFYRQISVLSP